MFVEIKLLPRKHNKATGNPPRALVLKCDCCGNIFERKWLKETYEAKSHFCNLSCHYSSQRGLGTRGAEIVETSCLTCDKPMKFRKVGNDRKWGKTCSKKCYGVYRSSHPDLYAQNTALMHTEESWKKISEYIQEKMSQPGWTPNFKGSHHTEETKARMRELKQLNPPIGEKNGMYGRKHTDQSRDKMSEVRTRKLIEGATKSYGRNNHVCGDYKSSKTERHHRFRSSWERETMRCLDTLDVIVTWNYECLRIPYYYDNKKRWYVPDFLVEFTDGRREIWEIKPKELVSSRACQLKTEAAIKFCELENISGYKILTRDELKQMGIL